MCLPSLFFSKILFQRTEMESNQLLGCCRLLNKRAITGDKENYQLDHVKNGWDSDYAFG